MFCPCYRAVKRRFGGPGQAPQDTVFLDCPAHLWHNFLALGNGRDETRESLRAGALRHRAGR
eukprot:COSAG05_NODE_537_length_8855_cov_23.915829_5_plen_62_part_00